MTYTLHMALMFIIRVVVGRPLGVYSSSDLSLLGCAEIEIVKPSDPQYDVIVAFPEDSNFERWEGGERKGEREGERNIITISPYYFSGLPSPRSWLKWHPLVIALIQLIYWFFTKKSEQLSPTRTVHLPNSRSQLPVVNKILLIMHITCYSLCYLGSFPIN